MVRGDARDEITLGKQVCVDCFLPYQHGGECESYGQRAGARNTKFQAVLVTVSRSEFAERLSKIARANEFSTDY